MAQDGGEIVSKKPIVVHKLWQEFETVQVDMEESGHGGGDKRLQDKIFVNPEVPDPFGRTAGSRDGAMSVLIGIAARKSIQSGKPIKISELTDLEPQVRRT
jgi:hypothetical protein